QDAGERRQHKEFRLAPDGDQALPATGDEQQQNAEHQREQQAPGHDLERTGGGEHDEVQGEDTPQQIRGDRVQGAGGLRAHRASLVACAETECDYPGRYLFPPGGRRHIVSASESWVLGKYRRGSMSEFILALDAGMTSVTTVIARAAAHEELEVAPFTVGRERADIAVLAFITDDGDAIFGAEAAERGRDRPERLVHEFTRWIGDPAPIVVGGFVVSADELFARM